jgi:hypothetical protein
VRVRHRREGAVLRLRARLRARAGLDRPLPDAALRLGRSGRRAPGGAAGTCR